MVISCKKSNEYQPCNGINRDYYLPDSLNKYFKSILDSASEKVNYQAKSNSGLSETMTIYRDGPYYSSSSCATTNYWVNSYIYHSNLYKNYFTVELGFQSNYYPNGWIEEDDRVYTDSINLKIHYAFQTDTNSLPYIVDLIQPIAPKYSTRMKVAYFTHDRLPAYTQYIFCDTCIQYIGKYSIDNHMYNEVYKYISPINFGNSETLEELLIDKQHGVIQFNNKDKIIWTVSPF